MNTKDTSKVAFRTEGILRGTSIVIKCAICTRLIGGLFPRGRCFISTVGRRTRHYEGTIRVTTSNEGITIIYDNSTKICNVTSLICRVTTSCRGIRIDIITNISTVLDNNTLIKTPLKRSFTIVDLDSLLAP